MSGEPRTIGEAPPPPTPEDEEHEFEMEMMVGRLLQVGVAVAAVVVLFGGLWYLSGHGFEREPYAHFRGEPPSLTSVSGVLHGLLTVDARAVVQAGLLLLVATPIARVALSIFGFAHEKDRLYVGITVLVLALLLVGLFAG
jgi:uncharacterized membrane protein